MAKLYVTPAQFDWFQKIMNDPCIHSSELVRQVKASIACLVLAGQSEGLDHAINLIGTPMCPEIHLIVDATLTPADRCEGK